MGFGHGKVILLGEHSVVYGRPALAASLGRGVEAHAKAAEADTLEVEPWGVSIVPDVGAEDPLARAFAAVLASRAPDAGGAARHGVAVRARVDLPGSAGLGCSAALGVAVIRALDELFGREREAAEVAEHSLAWERVFHGNPSGVDSAMAAGAGLAVFRRSEPLEPVRNRLPLRLIVGHSGEAGSTHEMVASVARQHAQAPARLEQTFDGIASLVRNATLAVEAGDLAGFGRLMDLNQALLNSLMVSTAKLEEMCAAARHAGALGAKLTGAGGGGCMIALVDGEPAAGRVLAALRELGADAFTAEAGT